MIPSEAALTAVARIQATLWTGIDAVCVALVLVALDRLRAREGRPRARVRWTMLVVSLHLGALLASVVDIPALARLARDLEARDA